MNKGWQGLSGLLLSSGAGRPMAGCKGSEDIRLVAYVPSVNLLSLSID